MLFYNKNYIVMTQDILRPLVLDEILVIKEIIDSKLIIVDAKNTFKAGINIGSCIKNDSINESSINTKEILVKPLELIKNASNAEIFNSNNLDEVCFTQAQIIRFCENYSHQLNQPAANLFLFNENGEYFVASVTVFSDGLYVQVTRFDDDDDWCGLNLHRVFVPENATLAA